MLRRLLPFLVLGLTCFALATAVPAAQKGKGGKGKPPDPEPVPGVAVVRCADEFDVSADVVCGDGSGVYVDSTLPGGDPGVTVGFTPAGNFLLRTSVILDPTLNRAHVVRIPDRDDWVFEDCEPQCVADIPAGGLIVYTDPDSTDNAAFGAGIDSGLVNMSDGEVVDNVRLLMGFPDPDPASNIRWSLYWNPEYYVGTSYGTATRDGCTWTISADADALAGFWLFRVGKGKYQNAQEGRFAAPVEITFTADPSACPSGS